MTPGTGFYAGLCNVQMFHLLLFARRVSAVCEVQAVPQVTNGSGSSRS